MKYVQFVKYNVNKAIKNQIKQFPLYMIIFEIRVIFHGHLFITKGVQKIK